MTDATSENVYFTIKGKGSAVEHSITNVRTVYRLRLPTQTISTKELLNWPHLKHVRFEGYENVKPQILIGQDNWELGAPIKIVKGKKGAPVASFTQLGWIVHGPVRGLRMTKGYAAHATEANEADYQRCDRELHDLVKSYFKLESVGVSTAVKISTAETRALQILRNKTVRIGDRRMTSHLWKDAYPTLPNNYDSAKRRLESLEKKLAKYQPLKELYCQQIDNLLQQGYARRITTEENHNTRTWYLPHFAVRNPNKPGKIRLVFDAAAKTRGISLNDKLLKGPDLLKQLPGVLMRFRQKPVAINGDIREMFLQIKIAPQDQHVQRFLWRDMDGSREPGIYVMTSLIFGATSSPCTALYIKNLNAEEFRPEYPQAAAAIIHKHYMDDYLDSVENDQEAKKIITDVTEVHKRGGFEIRGWASNVPGVLQGLEKKSKAQGTVDIRFGACKLQETLGLGWKPEKDTLVFNAGTLQSTEYLLNTHRRPTKREILQVIMSIFDPLGFLTLLTLKGKILMQDVWRSKIGWDDTLQTAEQIKWSKWIKNLTPALKCEIPRCYIKSSFTEVELHVFCDASEQAHASVADWVFVHSNGNRDIAFITGKSRVSPLKMLSIPKLELQAALIGSRLAKAITTEHEFKATRRVMWTDSMTVLHWIRNEPKRYTSFVAHRLGEIEELTDVSEWRWVPSKENPGDDATRDSSKEISYQDRWFHGPKFLSLPEENWPHKPLVRHEEIVPDDVTHHTLTMTDPRRPLPDITRFSSWNKLIRTTAWLLYVSDIPRSKKLPREGITASHLIKAERLWIADSQTASFSVEIEACRNNRPVKTDSRITQLSPYLNKQGLLEARGRIQPATGIRTTVKSPVILDANTTPVC